MDNSRSTLKYCRTEDFHDNNGECKTTSVMKKARKDVNYIKVFLPLRGVYNMYPSEMTPASRMLIDYLCVVCNKRNEALAPEDEVIERTGMSTATLSRARKQLMELDYIRKVRANMLMLNPNFVFKDDGDARPAACVVYNALPTKKAKNV